MQLLFAHGQLARMLLHSHILDCRHLLSKELEIKNKSLVTKPQAEPVQNSKRRQYARYKGKHFKRDFNTRDTNDGISINISPPKQNSK